jgi:hypothetical protein
MKQFFLNLISWLTITHPAIAHREVMKLIESKRKPIPEGINTSESKRKMRKRRLLKCIRRQASITWPAASSLNLGITIPELVEYYHYFGSLPKEDYRIILRNYGVRSLLQNVKP